MSKRYVALIADATASRLLPPARRARLQADARAAAQQLNRRYARVLAARFAVTLGDELQCLLPSPAPPPPGETRAPDPPPPPRRRLGHRLRPRDHQHAPRTHRARDRRALLPPGPRRHGRRQAAAPRLHVRRLPPRDRAARSLLWRPLLELDPAAAAHRDAGAPGRPGGGRRRAGRRPPRRFPSRPPRGLASGGGRR